MLSVFNSKKRVWENLAGIEKEIKFTKLSIESFMREIKAEQTYLKRKRASKTKNMEEIDYVRGVIDGLKKTLKEERRYLSGLHAERKKLVAKMRKK